MPYAPRKWKLDKGLRGPRHSPTGVVGCLYVCLLVILSRYVSCLLHHIGLSQISSARDTFEKEKRNAKHTLQTSRPTIAIMMSLIAAWRQGKEREKVPPANIDSRLISFGEHAAVRAPLSRPNLLKRSSGHPPSPVMLFAPYNK
ncbi:uncharacterized protein TrAtP1_000124 [Trichoderma atroviride]|uniref:uncharacterized protein n=1 Tax=Hypocrea atroviridis TaxID=63577 RepID=UPI00332614C0|nr:hypothetical protein TrAtP1_000124 [Trichoderma atroviride]